MKVYVCPICGKNLEQNVSFKAGETVICECRPSSVNGNLMVDESVSEVLPLPTPQEVQN